MNSAWRSRFLAREADQSDFLAIRRLSGDDRLGDPVLKVRLQREFEAVVSAVGFPSVLLEQAAGPRKGQVAAALLSVFVTPEFADDIISATKPFVCARIHEWKAAGLDPFPDVEQMATLNAGGGLDLFISEWVIDSELAPGDLNQAKLEALEAFVDHHGGWKLRRLMSEACLPPLHDGLRNVGFREWNTYEAWFEANRSVYDTFRPILFGIDQEATRETTDHTILRLFSWQTPRCQFTDEDVELVQLAMYGLSDVEIVEKLCLGSEAIRQRWSRVARQVEIAYPGTLPPNRTEARFALREFMKRHLFELRPYGTTKRRGAGRPKKA